MPKSLEYEITINYMISFVGNAINGTKQRVLAEAQMSAREDGGVSRIA